MGQIFRLLKIMRFKGNPVIYSRDQVRKREKSKRTYLRVLTNKTVPMLICSYYKLLFFVDICVYIYMYTHTHIYVCVIILSIIYNYFAYWREKNIQLNKYIISIRSI